MHSRSAYSRSEAIGHPIGGLQAPATAAIIGDMIAVGDQHQLDRAGRFAGETLGVLPGHQTVLFAGDDAQRTGDRFGYLFER